VRRRAAASRAEGPAIHAYDRPDGKVTLAVVVGMEQRGFEGEDRVFLAVTKVLDP
jgi:hypothetical protein